MTRTHRTLLAGGLAAAAALAALLFWPRPSAPPAPLRGSRPAWLDEVGAETRRTRPDLLLVVYDARRRDDFSFGPFGNRRGDTPFLANFKERALYFEDAISPGSYLSWQLLQELFGSGLTRYWMGPGANAYKGRWTDRGEQLFRAGAYSQTIRGRLHQLNDRVVRPAARTALHVLRASTRAQAGKGEAKK